MTDLVEEAEKDVNDSIFKQAETASKRRGVRWWFTLNNYTEDELQLCRRTLAGRNVSFAIFGRERGAERNTPHLQGYFETTVRLRLTQCKKLAGLERAKFGEADGTAQHNIDYVTKEDPDAWRHGEPRPAVCVAANAARQAAYSTALGLAREGRLAEIDAGIYIRHYSALNSIAAAGQWTETARCRTPAELVLREWQRVCLDIMEQVPDGRSAHIVVDGKGSSGKTTFSTWLREHHFTGKDGRKRIQVLRPSKSSNLARLLRPADIYILDCPRDENDIPYALIESMLDGHVFSGKYDVMDKLVPLCHVFVFTNSPPKDEALSGDRWVFIDPISGKIKRGL